MDVRDLDFNTKKLDSVDSKLELQLREAKIKVLKDRIASKEEKVADIQKNLNKLTKKSAPKEKETTEETKKVLKKEPKLKKIYIGKGTHFFPKANIAQFLIEENEIKVGDTILIKGSTTGEQHMIIDEMFVNEIASEKAVSGDTCTFKVPFRIRLSDKLYKIQN